MTRYYNPRFLGVCLLAVGGWASAFTTSPRHGRRCCSWSTVSSSTAADAFESYQQDDSQTTLAIRNIATGSGDLSAETNQLVSVAYTLRLMDSGMELDQGDAFLFRLGEGKVIPGWEQGILGMKVGGKRMMRIPPSLAYGQRGYAGKIPPKSHLEFDVELLQIASNPQEEFMMRLQDFGVGRVLGMIAMLGLFVIAPNL